ncbi:hypothetical protein HO173_004075 [Letharia columbiana]|uniref:Nucleoprotein TPR/MLP1 domain-containing protein n=1 Tax=Letharia columbiana TaxID=112416 RepID=A0A8H6FZV6_9LECA|nr:uncharacterized protein HO173_004075 [Letharia columbiana]KAF6237874.1 hypothetical protein HO173_004075 [Letharia columbiana]
MAVAQLDVAQLSSFCSLPQQSIDTLLDAPTAGLVRTLLENISVKAHEHNDLASEILKLGVELENAVRGGETKSRVLKSSIDKGLKEATDLRQKLQAEETARASVETELENLRTSTSTITTELSTLRTRITSLESSNRDTLSLLESKTTAHDNLAQELNAQHQKTVELRREVSNLEQSAQSANAASTSARFHEQGLQQEIESLKRNNDWLDKELKTKSGEYTKYRKEKSLRITDLQRQLDDATSTIDAANRTETTLRRRLDELGQKADDSFTRVQQLQEDAAKKDESFRVELDAANRLTELTRNSANTERQRQQDLFAQLDSAKEDASEQLGRLGAELETEHRERVGADAKIAELEVQVEQLQADLSTLQSQASKHNASHQGTNGHAPSTPLRGDSAPMVPSSPSRFKGGLSITQMYSSYNDLKSELEAEKRRSEKLTSTLDDMVQDLETEQPEIEELRADHIRLESEVAEMSSLVEIIGKERDQALKGAKKWEGHLEAKVKEGEVLRQQLRDLSSQVKVFLMEVHLRDQGLDDLGADGRARLERLAQGQADGEAMEGTTATGRLISENLVTFRNVSELQEQNANLLRITREIGERMEHEEAVQKQSERTRDWDDLQQKYERCKDEIKSLMTQSSSYIRERDMFRRMLSHRGQLPPGTDVTSLFGESVNGAATPKTPTPAVVINSIEDSPTTRDLADYAKLYKDIQAHFDAYRHEAATDRSTLKEQVDGLSKVNSELRSEVVRNSSQVTLAHERYEMLQGNYVMLKNENTELQKRSQALSDTAAKQDMRVQQVAEELVEAKGLADSMRNETANLKAEKEFWKTIEKRITEDNENLLNERGRLNALNANLQTLLNEREHSDTEARRRLQTQADNLERELQATKNKLSDEVEENKRSAQRREYDHEQSQKRIDDLVSSLGNTREELVAAKTIRDHLSTRVDELTIELRSAEERVNALRPAPSGRPNTNDGENLQHQSLDGEDSNLTKEQGLRVQVSELKRDLDLARSELENVKGQVEQYKAISQASEEELLSLNETQDLYRQETDKLIEKKDSKLKELEQRIEDTSSELASTNSELSSLRNAQAENGRRLEEHKKGFEAELAQLKDQDDRHAAAAQFFQEDLKVQADIAQQAQQNYENELVKHADAAKALQKVRSDHNELKLEIKALKTDAESARKSLNQSEDSWAESRQGYERELAELKIGRENLTAQNNHLHQQIETYSAQIASLKKHPSNSDERPSEDIPASGLENLQEVIKYLRREKEIVDVQLELSAQEGKRLKQQLDYAQSQLDDTRLRLSQQRRLEADNERSNLDHHKLVDTINELNTFRESSVTLRAETRQAQSALAVRAKEVEELKAQIEPLQAEILELKNERETQDGEMKLLKENSDRWQQRAQNVLQKYDRVDPAELEALKEQLKSLEAERDELVSAKTGLQDQVDNASGQITQVQEQSNEKIETMRAKLAEQYKARSRQLSDKIKEKDTALQTAMTEKASFEHRLTALSGLQVELETTRAQRDAAVEKATAQKAIADSSARDGSEEGQVEEEVASKPDLQDLQEKLTAAEMRANEATSESADNRSQLDVSRSRITELELQIKQMQEGIDASTTELAQLRIQQQQAVPANSEVEAHMSSLRADLAQAQQDAQDLRTNASINAAVSTAPTESGSKSVTEQVAEHVEAVRVELESRHDERVRQNDETLERRTNIMKAQLSKKLTDGKGQLRQSLTAEHEQALQSIKSEHEQEMSRLQARHKDEIEELRRGADSKFSKLRDEWGMNHQAKHTINDDPNVKDEDHTPRGPWQPSEDEARALIQSNEIVRSIVKKNIGIHVNKAKEEVSTQLNQDHEKAMTERITEVQNKANTAKEHAVLMEGKKSAVQINMANNKARMLQYRVDIVKKAAQDTPLKPVEEVWLIAKDAKPPPVTPQQPQQSQQNTNKAQKAPVTSNFGQPTPIVQNPAQQGQTDAQGHLSGVSTFGRPTPSGAAASGRQSPARQGLTNAQEQLSGVSTFGRPTPAVRGPPPAAQSGRQSPAERPSHAQPQPSNDQRRPQPAMVISPQPGSIPPQRPAQGATTHHPNPGTGPGALKGLQQSGLPVARGGSMRGNPISRGRGSAVSRGGPQTLDTSRSQGQQGGRGSPTSAGLNAGARQFIPGNKRPRDDGQEGGDGGNGKRIRGDGGPA